MRYKNPCSTADIIVERNSKILLVKRKHSPFKGMWAIPGGFLDYGRESLERAAVRELKEETNLKADESDLVLLGVYSSPDRDPRGHVIAHVYVARKTEGTVKANDDAEDVKFFPLNNLPKLAFDHEKIIKDYISWKNKQ